MTLPISVATARLTEAEVTIERLRTEVAELQRLLTLSAAPLPLEWGLTAMEARLMRALVTRPVVSKELATFFLYGRGDIQRSEKIIDVTLHKVRKKLAPFGLTISTVYGCGWALDETVRRRLASQGPAA